MGRFLSQAGEVPDAALTSPALRASETLRLAAEAGGWGCEGRVCEALYGSVTDVLGELRRLPDSCGTVVVVGHEPTSSELAATLAGGGHLRLPTAAMVRIDLDVGTWADLRPDCGEIAWLMTPSLLEAVRRRT